MAWQIKHKEQLNTFWKLEEHLIYSNLHQGTLLQLELCKGILSDLSFFFFFLHMLLYKLSDLKLLSSFNCTCKSLIYTWWLKSITEQMCVFINLITNIIKLVLQSYLFCSIWVQHLIWNRYPPEKKNFRLSEVSQQELAELGNHMYCCCTTGPTNQPTEPQK